eukprot:9449340-Ditylum_brightwellii.AAC.1
MDLHPRNNLPLLMIRTKKTMEENRMGLQAAVELCHVHFSAIQWLARSRHLPIKNPDAVDKCQIHVCTSCQFAKQKRRPHKATRANRILRKRANSRRMTYS